jgi:hypothetical protein
VCDLKVRMGVGRGCKAIARASDITACVMCASARRKAGRERSACYTSCRPDCSRYLAFKGARRVLLIVIPPDCHPSVSSHTPQCLK